MQGTHVTIPIEDWLANREVAEEVSKRLRYKNADAPAVTYLQQGSDSEEYTSEYDSDEEVGYVNGIHAGYWEDRGLPLS